jgi:hypothetical protein
LECAAAELRTLGELETQDVELPGSSALVDGTLRSSLVWEAIVVAGLGLSAALLGLRWLLAKLRWGIGVRIGLVLLALAVAAAISPALFNATARAIWKLSGDDSVALCLMPTNYAIRDFLPALVAASGVSAVALRRALRAEVVPPSRPVA